MVSLFESNGLSLLRNIIRNFHEIVIESDPDEVTVTKQLPSHCPWQLKSQSVSFPIVLPDHCSW